MAREWEESDNEPLHLEPQAIPHDTHTFENYRETGAVPASYQLAADYLGLSNPGQNDRVSLHAVEALRQMYDEASHAGCGPLLQDWRHPPRPKSARYMRPSHRFTPSGGGGAPLQRPSSAHSGRRPPKTERWRESGATRWPKESSKTRHSSDPSDGDPLRRGNPEQPNWTGELWIRSLRRPGMEIQDPAYHDVAQRGMRELHEEWQGRPAPRRPQSARARPSRVKVPYGGSTAVGEVALPRKHDVKDWVERPVSTGKMSLKHFGGQRYTFNQEPRYLVWEEFTTTINPART